MKPKKAIIKNNLFMLKIIARHAPVFLFWSLFISAFTSLSWFVEHILGIKYIMDIVESGGNFIHVVYWILVMFAFTLLLHICDGFFYEYITPKHTVILTTKMKETFYRKAAEIDVACYDEPNFYNEFVWNMGEAPNRAIKIINQTGEFISGITSILLSSAFFLAFDPIGMVFVTVSFAGSFLINLALNKHRFAMNREVRFKERKRSYFHRIFYLKDHAKEIRLNDISNKLKSDFVSANEDIRDEVDKRSKKIVAMSFLSKYIFNDFFFNGLYIMYLVYSIVIARTMGLGSFLALYRLSSRMNRSMQSIARAVPDFQENSIYIDKMNEFLNLEPAVCDTENPFPVPNAWKTLEFINVCFNYGETAVLKNFNMRIENGDKIAVVGSNGAGKTTLIKLIMRLYDVTSGEILLDGINIKSYKLSEYRALFSSVFQNYQIYAAGLDENVIMDANGGILSKIQETLRLAGFSDKLEQMQQGLSTPLTTEFEANGVDLSGGEAQKVAIARTFYNDNAFIILDEPSSALDPISEYHLYDSILNSASDKTLIFISHRLSSTTMADTIVLIKDGEISETGSHVELMRNDRDYAGMFRAQAEYYSY